MELYQIPPLSEVVISLEEQGEKLKIEEKEACELIEEILIPQDLEKDEEQELPRKVSMDDLEVEFDNKLREQKEQVVECEDLKEVPTIDFVFGYNLRIDEEKPMRISTYLMNSWRKGVQGKEQARRENVLNTIWNQFSENFL